MDAVLLAGGYGTRLRPLTYTRPKPLLPVAGRPMLEWVLDRLPDDVERVIVAVNWQAEKLQQHFDQSERNLELVVVRENEPLGTAGAVKNCQDKLQDDELLVLNADIVSSMDLSAMAAQHRSTKAIGTIAVKEVAPDEVVNFGVIEPADDDARRIAGFVEKPQRPEDAPSNLINAGAYLLQREVVDMIPAGKLVSMEKEIFPKLLGRGFYGWRYDGQWVDVGDADRLRQTSAMLGSGNWHGANARVDASAKVTDSVAGDRLTVGAAAIVTNCVMGDDVTIDNGIDVRNCVVGDGQSITKDMANQRVWSGPLPVGYPESQVGNAL